MLERMHVREKSEVIMTVVIRQVIMFKICQMCADEIKGTTPHYVGIIFTKVRLDNSNPRRFVGKVHPRKTRRDNNNASNLYFFCAKGFTVIHVFPPHLSFLILGERRRRNLILLALERGEEKKLRKGRLQEKMGGGGGVGGGP